MMTATPALILRGQLQELGDYTQGESVTPGPGPGLRVQIGARQVVVPLDREQLQALDLQPDQEVELVVRPLGSAPAAAPPAPPPLFQEGDFSFKPPGEEMMTGSAAERAAVVHARRELHSLVHEVLGMRRRAEDDPKEGAWWGRLWALLELLVVLTRACPFCGCDRHVGRPCVEPAQPRTAAPREDQTEDPSPALLERARALGEQNGTDVRAGRTRLLATDEVLTQLELPAASGHTMAVMAAFAAGFEEPAPAVRTRSAVGRQRVLLRPAEALTVEGDPAPTPCVGATP